MAGCWRVGKGGTLRRKHRLVAVHTPMPLAWMTEARYRRQGVDAAWPLLVELAWLAPKRLDALLRVLADPLLNRLRRRFEDSFDAVVESSDGRDGLAWFDDILVEKKAVTEVPARYGLVMELLRLKDYARATKEVNRLLQQAPDASMVVSLAGRVKTASKDVRGALDFYASAIRRFPRNRAINYDYARLLLENKRRRHPTAHPCHPSFRYS